MAKAKAKQETRVIESKDRRIVHFVFDPKQRAKQTPFCKKFNQWLAGDIEAAELEEQEKFDAYIERFVEDQLEEGEHNPVTFEENQFPETVLNGINHVSFAVANNPFYKIDPEKYYPEALVMNKEGKQLAWLSCQQPNASPDAASLFPSLKDCSGFRDDKVRVNDDRKICLNLDEFRDPSTVIVFMMKTFDLRKAKDLPENTYDEAWFRLQNETTS